MALRTEAVTPAEWEQGALEAPKLERLAQSFLDDGVVIIENVLSHSMLDHIAEMLDYAAAVYIGEDKGYERGAQGGFPREPERPGLQICSGLPRQAPWITPELASNPIIEQCAQEFLRGEVFIRYFNCNTSCPGSGTQMIHADQDWAWTTAAAAAEAGEAFPHRCTRIFVNFGVDAMTPENGSTELWPGTHRLTEAAAWPPGWYHEADGWLPQSQRGTWLHDQWHEDAELCDTITATVDRQRVARPPLQIRVPKGAVAIRDNRCWVSATTLCSASPKL